jgi:hypothetical protein
MAAGDYPLPAYAGYIWDRGDALILTFPDSAGGQHSVQLPIERLSISDSADQRGWLILRDVLHARRSSYQQEKRVTTADRAAPTRRMVEEMLKRQGVTERASRSTEVDIFAQGFAQEED